MSLIKKKLIDTTEDILKMYNLEYGEIHPISERLFQDKIAKSDLLIDDLSYSLYKENQFIGCIAVKKSAFITNQSKLYISFIYIVDKLRKKGFGKEILSEVLNKSQELGYNEIIVGGDEQCIFSGVFHKNNEHTNRFFINFGFSVVANNINLILHSKVIPVYENPKYDYSLGVDEIQKDEVLSLVKQHFSPRWVKELSTAENKDIGIILDKGKIIGFINTGTKNSKKLPNSLNDYLLYDSLAGIGPLGVSPDYQGQGLGLYLVNRTLHELIHNGASDIMVDWTGLDYFYRKCGFTDQHEKYTIYNYRLEKLQ